MASKSADDDSGIAFKKGYSDNSERNSREDALDDFEFERLYRGAQRIDCDIRRLEAEFIVLVGGRLGLRAGELCHFEASWVNEADRVIDIPDHVECTNGRDNGLCGYCRSRIDEICSNNEEVEPRHGPQIMWSPKTEAGVRSVPYGFDARVELVVSDFIDRFESYPHSNTSIGRRVDRAAHLARGISEDDVYPHCLRSSAASFHASHGLPAGPLKSMFGWEKISTAEKYVDIDSRSTARAVTAAHHH